MKTANNTILQYSANDNLSKILLVMKAVREEGVSAINENRSGLMTIPVANDLSKWEMKKDYSNEGEEADS